jgi:N-acetylmuramoyl-L-alanine amidase
MATQLRRAGESERRLVLLTANCNSACGIAGRAHRTLLAAIVILLVLPGAAVAATLPVAASAAPRHGWASTAELRYGGRGRTVASLQRRLVTLGYLERSRINGIFGKETWDAVVALQGWEQIHRDGVVGPQTRRALRHAQTPQPWLRLRRALEIDLARQVLLVVENGTVQRAVHASTGAFFPTPKGRFAVVRRLRESWSRPYQVWLPYALYFDRGFAIHAFPIVPDRPASHGCIRIPLENAPFVFRAAPLGTPVLIRGPRRVPRG